MADPANLVVVVVDNDAALSWDGSPTPGVADYSIFRRSPSTGAVFNPAGTPIASGITSLTYGDNNLPAGTYDWQVFGRVVAATVAPTITSPNNTSFTGATPGTFTVTATGTPTPTLSMTGTLPAGVTFNPTTGVLSGTPSAVGTFPLVFTAANGTLPNAVQNFTLTVTGAAPAITSAASTSFTQSSAGTFTVTKTGTPTPTLSMTGTLPSGVTFVAATGVLAGTPTASGTFPLVFTASNGITPNAVQNFTLTVNAAVAWTPASLPSLLGWWDADDPATIIASGSPAVVSQWNNKKAGGVNAVQATAGYQPITGTRTVNGRNGFDISNQWVTAALGLVSQPVTILFVVSADTTPANAVVHDATTGARIQTWLTAGPVWATYAGAVVNTSAGATGPVQVVAVYNGASSAFYKNGTQHNGALNPGTSGTDNLAIGNSPSYPSPFDGILCEFVITNAVISGADITNWKNYCTTKWGTP